MAPVLTIDKKWETHGWWIAMEEPLKAFLWMTDHPFEIGKRTSALGKRFGEIQAITTRPYNDMIYVMCVPEVGQLGVKTSLSKTLLLAPIPTSLLQTPGQVKFLNSLQKFWLNTSLTVRTARHEHVLACLELSPEDVVRAKKFMSEHIRYEALRQMDPARAITQNPPAEPEETEPIYRALAKPTQLDWRPLAERTETEDHHPVASSEFSPSRIPLSRSGRPSKRPRRDEGNIVSVEQSTGLDAFGTRSIRRASASGGRPRRSRPRTVGPHRRSSASTPGGSVNLSIWDDGLYNLSNQPSGESEDETEIPPDAPTSRYLKAPVPTKEEIAKGSIWGDIVFNAHIDRIAEVVNPETNHRVLSQKRVRDVYNLLRDPEKRTGVSKLVLRPIRYIMFTTTDTGTVEREEVPFPVDGAAREFQRLFLIHGDASIHGSRGSQLSWLQERIIWEPVDGQHIVAASKYAKEQCMNNKIPKSEFQKTFEQRQATFVVYDDRRLYISKSVRINNAEWNRKSLSTMSEDLRKLRQIWDLYGRPDSLLRADDERRAIALVSAASAVRRLPDEMDKEITTKKLAKNMQDLTHHAWNPSSECFDAILQVCKDYEDGLLFYSKEEEKKWKELARKKNLNPNVDIRPKRQPMTQNWLRPLSRVPDSYYLQLAKSSAANPVGEDGRRPRQAYYFNGVKDRNPESRTVAGVVERIVRREAARNTIRWLMVDNNECSPNSMEDFFRISIQKYIPQGISQLDGFGKLLDSDTKAKWAAPVREKVSKLNDISNLIPPFITVHYQNIATGRRGFTGLSVDEQHANTGSWEWQMHVRRPSLNDTQDPLLIRCRRGLFRSDYVKLTQSYLWVIDCRRGGGRYSNGPWEDEQFTTAFAQLALWMTNTERWNVIFLLPPAVYANEELFAKLKLPEDCSHLHGCWAFGSASINHHALNFTEGGRLRQAVEPFGGMVICMQHPVGTSPDMNFVLASRPLPLIFHDQWGESRQPCTVDLLERSPSELSRLVRSYLPRGWGLVACNMSTAIPAILHSDFQGSEIIVIDDCSERVSFLYNELLENFQGHLLVSNRTCGTNSARNSVEATEDAVGREEDTDEVERGLNVRLPRQYGSDESSLDTHSSEDERSREEEEDDEEEEEEEQEEVEEEDTRDVVLSTPPPVGAASEETLETPTEGVDASLMATVVEGGTFVSQMSEMDRGTTDSLNFFSVQMRVREPLGPIQVERGSETQGRDEGIGRDIQPILSSIPICSGSEDVAAFQGAFSSIMSFRDGFYYNDDGIRHTRHGEPGNYRYVQCASVSFGDRSVHDDELADMVNNAMEHVFGVASP